MFNKQSTVQSKAACETIGAWLQVDMVIEAAVERVDLKQSIFADLEQATRPDCILSSNTSTIDLNLIGKKTRGAAGRIVGAHFFSPAHVMPLLEIVRTEHTTPQVRRQLCRFHVCSASGNSAARAAAVRGLRARYHA